MAKRPYTRKIRATHSQYVTGPLIGWVGDTPPGFSQSHPFSYISLTLRSLWCECTYVIRKAGSVAKQIHVISGLELRSLTFLFWPWLLSRLHEAYIMKVS